MVGQSEYVVNGGLTYASGGGFNATVLYNVVGPRIVGGGRAAVPGCLRAGRATCGPLGAGARCSQRTSLKLDAKNLLDAPYRSFRAECSVASYKTGRVSRFGSTLAAVSG